MIRGMDSAAAALEMATLNQEVVAENLANANTPGYRRQGLTFESVRRGVAENQPTATASLGGAPKASAYTNFDQGPLQSTGNPLDLALSSNAFFVLEGPNGPLYTRNGSFQLNSQGQLQSASGLPVKSGGGRITIPPNTSQINVSRDGTVSADNIQVGRLELATFSDSRVLQRAGTTLFQGPAPRTPEPGTVSVEQGFREGSNVQIVNEMVTMMTGMRHYEAVQKALHALGDAVALGTRPQS